MAQEEFAPEGLRILGQTPSAPRQQIGEGQGRDGLLQVVTGTPLARVKVEAGEAGAVLAAVVLLLEHQRGLAEAIGTRAVFLTVSGGGPPQP